MRPVPATTTSPRENAVPPSGSISTRVLMECGRHGNLPLLEIASRRTVAVVLLHGVDDKKADMALEKLRASRRDITLTMVLEHEEMPKGAELVVFLANGTSEGAMQFLARANGSAAGVPTLLVSEHEDGTGQFDHTMRLDDVVRVPDELVRGMNSAYGIRTGHPFISLL